MAEEIIWSVTVRAQEGPQLAASGTISVDTYDKHRVSVPAGGDLTVELGPQDAGLIRCLAIVPAAPDPDLTYEVGTETIALDEPLFLFRGGVDLAGNPKSLTFSNGTGADAVLDILVGRDATP